MPDLPDMRPFQTCKYYLLEKCKAGSACPFKHDKADLKTFQTVKNTSGAASAVPDGHCYFYLNGAAGCLKGSACNFKHDQREKENMTERRIQQPLSNVLPHHASRAPPFKPTSRPAASSFSARLLQAAPIADNSSLVIHLDESSPHSQQARTQHPHSQHSQPVQHMKHHNGADQLRRPAALEHSSAEASHPGFGRQQDRTAQLLRRQATRQMPESRSYQPAITSNRATEEQWEQQDLNRATISRSRSQVDVERGTKRAQKPSVLARLGPRCDDDDDNGDGLKDEAQDEAMDGLEHSPPLSGRQSSLKSRITLSPRNPPYDRKRGLEHAATNQPAEDTKPIQSRRVVIVPEASRSLTEAKRARVVQGPIELHRNRLSSTVPQQTPLRKVLISEPTSTVSHNLLRQRTHSDVALSAAPQQREMRSAMHSALTGSQITAGSFQPPKSREQLRREKEAAEGRSVSASMQERTQTNGAAAAMPSQARVPHSKSVLPQRSSPVVQQQNTAAATASPTPPQSAVTVSPLLQHTSLARKSSRGLVTSPRASSHTKAGDQTKQSSKPNPDKFEWNVDDIDDADDLVDDDGEDGDADLDLMGKGSVTRAAPSAAGASNDFEKELEAFQNAFE